MFQLRFNSHPSLSTGKMILGWGPSLVCLWIISVSPNLLTGQNPYPATTYSDFGRNAAMPTGSDFAISRPDQSDLSHGRYGDDYRSMSPNSWGQPGNDFDQATGFKERFRNISENEFIPKQPVVGTPVNGGASFNKFSNEIPPNVRTPGKTLVQPGQKKPVPLQPVSYPHNIQNQSAAQLPSAPQVPRDIRQRELVPATVLGSPNSVQPQAFPELNLSSEDANLLTSDSYYPLELSNEDAAIGIQRRTVESSIIRAPASSIPNPPTNPWSYPDSRMTPMRGIAGGGPDFRTDLGHRDARITSRNFGSEDYGQKYEFEAKKKEHPPLQEILATGRYFGSATMLYLRPSFTGNTSIAQTNSGNTETFDFDYEVAPQFQLGFESKYGPGIELTYWQFDETSNDSTFISNGIESGATSAWMMGSNQWSRLTANNAGETLNTNHSIDIESVGIAFFKEVKLPISRINGKFGFQYVSITHDMNATLTDSGATPIGSLRARADMQALGPQFKFEYFRPVGHTKLEFVTGLGGSVMFGRQDQFVVNSAAGNFSRIGADEFVTNFDFFSGAQYKKMIAENRDWFVRGGLTAQSWLNGGSAILPQDDFGLRGFVVTIGYNR